MTDSERCDTCRFWLNPDRRFALPGAEKSWEEHRKEYGERGFCRRFPLSQWRHDSDWCGEWQERRGGEVSQWHTTKDGGRVREMVFRITKEEDGWRLTCDGASVHRSRAYVLFRTLGDAKDKADMMVRWGRESK